MIWLDGEMLKGGYSLIRTVKQEKTARWLLIKTRDGTMQENQDIVETRPLSIKTGRSLDEIQNSAEIVA